MQGRSKTNFIIKFNPDSDYYYYRGVYYLELENYTSAIEDASNHIKYNPKSINGYNLRSRSFYAQTNYKKAIDDCGSALIIDQENLDSYIIRGKCNEMLKIAVPK